MLEVFSRDRDFDFEFFEISDTDIKYKTKNYGDVDKETKKLYHSLDNGTILLDGIPITIDNVSDKQMELITTISELHKDKYKKIKENYIPCFIKHTSGNNISSIIANKKVTEIPDRKHFKEWAYIKGYEFLQNYINEYYKKNSNEFKFKSKLMSIFK